MDLIDSYIGAPHLSMPRRSSMLLVFEFARLVPFVVPNVVGFSLSNPQNTFRIRKVKLVQKCPKKNGLRRIYSWFKMKPPFTAMTLVHPNSFPKLANYELNFFFKRLYIVKGLLVLVEKTSFSKEFQWEFQCGGEGMIQHDAHQIFDQNTLEMVTYVFLSVQCPKYVQTMQTQLLIPLFLRGNKGKLTKSLCKVCCSCALFHYWLPGPHENVLIYLLQYNSWLKSICEMTQFWHHPPLILELLAHESHFQSTFNAHQSQCMHKTTKLILKHSKFEHHPSYIRPPCKILAKHPCFFDPLPKFKRRISETPKNLDWWNQSSRCLPTLTVARFALARCASKLWVIMSSLASSTQVLFAVTIISWM